MEAGVAELLGGAGEQVGRRACRAGRRVDEQCEGLIRVTFTTLTEGAPVVASLFAATRDRWLINDVATTSPSSPSRRTSSGSSGTGLSASSVPSTSPRSTWSAMTAGSSPVRAVRMTSWID
jgi:hypothetical protein